MSILNAADTKRNGSVLNKYKPGSVVILSFHYKIQKKIYENSRVTQSVPAL